MLTLNINYDVLPGRLVMIQLPQEVCSCLIHWRLKSVGLLFSHERVKSHLELFKRAAIGAKVGLVWIHKRFSIKKISIHQTRVEHSYPDMHGFIVFEDGVAWW